MKRFAVVSAAIASIMVPTFAYAHVDLLILREGGRIVTGGYDFDASPGHEVVAPPLRVFGYEFGEIPGQPDFAEDPGFVSLAGTFPAGTTFSFSVRDDLKYWTGLAFGTPPNHESLLIERGSMSITVGTGGAMPLAGFSIGTTSDAVSGQQFHEHLSATLLGPEGALGPAPTDGIYLLRLLLHGTDGWSESEPFWVVYNHGLSEPDHELVMDWVQSHYAPEPASLLLLGAGGVVLIRARNRARVQGPGSMI